MTLWIAMTSESWTCEMLERQQRPRDGVSRTNVVAGGEEGVDVRAGLLDVALDVHREARSLGKSQAEVESNGSGNGSEPDEETPAEVDVVCVERGVGNDLLLERGKDDERDEGCRQLSPALGSKDGLRTNDRGLAGHVKQVRK